MSGPVSSMVSVNRVWDMEDGHDILAVVGSNELVAERGAGASSQACGAPSRNRSDQILDQIFASERFREWERSIAETAKRDAEKRKARPIERAPDRLINMEARREHGTYRGKS